MSLSDSKDLFLNFKDKSNVKPIGILDSGVGGLTVLDAVSKCMPEESIVYFGDTKRAPYGQRSKEEIVIYALQALNFLKSKDAKMILIACGTATSYMSDIKKFFKGTAPVFGIIEAASCGAAKATKNGKIGVLCTPVSAKVGLYEKSIMALNSRYKVYTFGCPILAPLIEKGINDQNYEKLCEAVKFYVYSLKAYGVDTIILGCTHYPIIKNVIEKYAGNEITLINPGEEVAKVLKNKLEVLNFKNIGAHERKTEFFVSGDPQKFSRAVCDILGNEGNPFVGQVDIEQYSL